MRKGGRLPMTVTSADLKMQRMAGVSRVYLHGCVGCHRKVWAPEDPADVCELCGGDRFDPAGKPKEFIVHFPLSAQIKGLLGCKQYAEAARHECRRTQTNPAYMCGNY